jgi:hypothetical protein
MDASRVEVPDEITVRYVRHTGTGLLCAISEDLPGLSVFGRSVDEIRDEVVIISAALVKERYGVDVAYEWREEDLPEGFVPLDNAGTLITLAA